jgi:hypothetical protein
MRAVVGTVVTVLVACLLVGGIIALASLRNKRVSDAEIGVHYTEGPIEGRHFEDVLEPGDSQWVVNDNVYKLPARQITWISGPGDEADAPALTLTAQGGEKMQVELATRFVLNTTLDENQNPFKTFFTGICQKFDCWDGAVGGQDPNDGWNRMLRETVGNPQQAAANTLGLQFEGEALRYDNETRTRFAREFADEFEKLQKEEVGISNAFCGPSYVRGEEDCPAMSVKVTNVVFLDPAREAIQEQRKLAEQQEALAVDQERAAVAQQRVNAAKATPEYQRLTTAQAMQECAKRPECSMTFIIGENGVPVTANAN